jgi:agmatine/peptidylarginine deiminase
MLIMSPQETSDFIKKGSIDARAVILPFLDDGQARIAFRAREDKQVYVLEIKADEAWVRDFCLSEGIAVLMAANVQEFYWVWTAVVAGR